MNNRFYVLLLGSGKEVAIQCRPDEIETEMDERGGLLAGEGDTEEQAAENAAKSRSTAGSYSGFGRLPGRPQKSN